DEQRDAVMDDNGRAVALEAPVGSLSDGALLTLVSVAAAPAPAVAHTTDDVRPRTDGAAPKWMLLAMCTLLVTAALADLASTTSLLSDPTRLAVGVLLGVGALGSGVLWVTRARGSGLPGSTAILVPLALSFTAAAVATPLVYRGAHLAVTAGLLAAALLTAALAAMAPDRTLRSVATSLTVGLLAIDAVWAGTLLLDAPTTAAAVITVGLIVPGLRLLPTTLLKLPDGYFIEYRHFLGNRWSVRGAVPHNPGPVSMDAVRPYVDEATARLTVGVLLLSAAGPAMAPMVTPVIASGSTLESVAAAVLLVLTIVALLLWARRTTAPVVRWAPRIAASLMALAVAAELAASADAWGRGILAGTLLGLALVAAAMLVPLSRQPSPLVWSRVGDVIETAAVVLALPAALLAAGTLEFVRAMVSG
ncbi:MAG: hypothetical protein ACK4MD_09655, partial [Demequina sp.]